MNFIYDKSFYILPKKLHIQEIIAEFLASEYFLSITVAIRLSRWKTAERRVPAN